MSYFSSGGKESEAIGDYVVFTDTHLPNKPAERTSLVYRETLWITASAYKAVQSHFTAVVLGKEAF